MHAPPYGERIGGICEFSLEFLRKSTKPKVLCMFARVVEDVHEVVFRYRRGFQRARSIMIALLDLDLLYRRQRRRLDDADALALGRGDELELEINLAWRG